MSAIDLRIVKKERIDEDEMVAESSQRYSPINGFHEFSSLEQRSESPRSTTARDSMAFVTLQQMQDDGRSHTENDQDKATINRSRFSSESIESYPYRVPIVYPIHSSPPIDYRSISSGRSPSPNNYRLEDGERNKSPTMNQRQLYEENDWHTTRESRKEEKYDENESTSERTSPTRKPSPFDVSIQNHEGRKERSASPNDPKHPNNVNFSAERVVYGRRRGKNSDRLNSAEDDKEEESLWKQVQRYRHRKRPALGKLQPTQEETIFMQYNEIRERRHREGRIITRAAGRPVLPHCSADIRETPLTPPPDNPIDQGDSKLRIPTRVPAEPPITPDTNGLESYGSQGNRARMVEISQSKGMASECITESNQDTLPSVQRPSPFKSTSTDSHPESAFDGNSERRKTPSEQLVENRSTPTQTQVDYQSYPSSSAHVCTRPQHYHDVRGMDARVVAHGAMDGRANLCYEDCCQHLSSYRHRPMHSLQRFHLGDNNCYDNSCHDNRRRRVPTCSHHCCHHKRSRRASSDDAGDYNDDNDDSNHWQYSPKEKRPRLEHEQTREMNDLYRREDQPHTVQNGSQPFSPSSTDSRDNESVENGQNQDFQPESEKQSYENGHLSQENSPRIQVESERRFSQASPFVLAEREPDDDDVICHVNGLFSLPGYRETKYDITRGELKRRTELPETLTRVEMISYVRQAKTSGRMLLDSNGITTSNRSHPTILSRVCEREAQVLACGLHKMNLEYVPLKKLVQICVDMYKSRGCDGCQDCRLKLRRRIVDVEITRYVMSFMLIFFFLRTLHDSKSLDWRVRTEDSEL